MTIERAMDEETEPLPFEGDRRRHRRFWRFDPTISTGSLLTIATMVVSFCVALIGVGMFLGRYEFDQKMTAIEIQNIKAGVLAEKVTANAQITELKQDVRKVQETITSVDKTVTGIKAEIDAKKGQKP